MRHALYNINIITSIVNSIIQLKIEEERMKFIVQIFVNFLRLISVPAKIHVSFLIIEWKGSIILRNIRQSFVPSSLSNSRNVNTASTVHSLILKVTLRPELFILCRKMLIFTSFISKPNGVRSTKNTIKHNVTTHITGRTSDVSHTSLTTTLMTYVPIGKQVHSLVNMKKDVSYRLHVWGHMAGRSKSITHFIIRQSLAKKLSAHRFYSVPSIILKWIEEWSLRIRYNRLWHLS